VPDDTRHVIVEDETLAAGFTQIPNLVLRRPDLQPGAKLTYMVLLSYAWDKDHAYPGQDRLAVDMGVSERSVITYLKQLSEAGLITIRRRGLGLTNIYILHRLTSGSEKSAPQARSAISAVQQVQDATPQEVQDLPRKKTQSNKTQEKNFEYSSDPSKYDSDRDVLLNYIADFAREFLDQAPLASSVTRAQNLYRASGLSLDDFIERMYAARSITKERSASVRGEMDQSGRKQRMAYFFSVLERELTKESA
jgi:DNA-binding PadR family transcriptional regulator